MDRIVTEDGFDFSFNPLACIECGGECCVGESGYIWVKYGEIRTIAEFLNLSVDEFSMRYLKRVNGRYSLKEIEFDEEELRLYIL